MHNFRFVDEDNKGWRFDFDLCNIKNLKTLALFGRWRIDSHSVLDNLIENTSSDTHSVLLGNIGDNLRQTVNTLLGNGRNENYRRILQENKLLAQSFGITQSGGIVLFVQIPLVDNQNNSLACLMSIAYDTFILLGNTLDSIKNHQHNVTAVNCAQ